MKPKREISYYAHLLFVLLSAVTVFSSCSEKKTERKKYNQTNSEVQIMAPLVQDHSPAVAAVSIPRLIIEYSFIPNPEYTPWSGRRVAQAKWKDARGNNIIIVSEISQYLWDESKTELVKYREEEEGNEVAELFARHYILPVDSNKWKLYWDFHKVKFSGTDVGIDYLPGTLTLSDVDSNSLAESAFTYHVTEGTQAIDFHYDGNLVMHIDSTEYWMAGSIGLARNMEEFKQRTTFSPNFAKQGEVYKNHMAHMWQHTIAVRDSLDNLTRKMWE